MLRSPEIIDLTLSSSSEASAPRSSESESVDILGSGWDRDSDCDRDEPVSPQSRPRAGSKRQRPDGDDATAYDPGVQSSDVCGVSQLRTNAPQRTQLQTGPVPAVKQGQSDGRLFSDTGATWWGGRSAGYASPDPGTVAAGAGREQQPVGVSAPLRRRTKLTARKTTGWQLTARKSTPLQRLVEPPLDRPAAALGLAKQPELSRSPNAAETLLPELSLKPAPGDPASDCSADAADSTQTVTRSPGRPPAVATSATGLLLEEVLRGAAELATAAPQPEQPLLSSDCRQPAALPLHQLPCAAAQEQGQLRDDHGAVAPPNRPPRAAAPKPGQLRDRWRARIRQRQRQEQQLRQHQQQVHAATAGVKRKATDQRTEKKQGNSRTAAQTAEIDVALCEDDRRMRAAAFAAAAGARLLALLFTHDKVLRGFLFPLLPGNPDLLRFGSSAHCNARTLPADAINLAGSCHALLLSDGSDAWYDSFMYGRDVPAYSLEV